MPTPQRASRDDPRDGRIRVITAMPPRAQAAGLRVWKTPLDGIHANPTMQEAKFKLSHYPKEVSLASPANSRLVSRIPPKPLHTPLCHPMKSEMALLPSRREPGQIVAAITPAWYARGCTRAVKR
jgi:hypothetical protein